MNKEIPDDELISKVLKIQFANRWTQKELANTLNYSLNTTNGILNKRYILKKLTRNKLIWFIETHS